MTRNHDFGNLIKKNPLRFILLRIVKITMSLAALKNLTVFTLGITSILKVPNVKFYCVRPWVYFDDWKFWWICDYGIISCSPYSRSDEFVEVFSSDNQWKLNEYFDFSLSWGFLIHGWTDSMFKNPKWTLIGRGIHCLMVEVALKYVYKRFNRFRLHFSSISH